MRRVQLGDSRASSRPGADCPQHLVERPPPPLAGTRPAGPLTMTDVVVIGAGFAGLSAAVRLVDRGRRVVVVEEAPRLGGRATSFADRETGERVDNGQHVLFGCYRETYDFLRRLEADHRAPLQSRLSVTIADDRAGVRARVPAPAAAVAPHRRRADVARAAPARSTQRARSSFLAIPRHGETARWLRLRACHPP